ncbi:MAG: hypothetical protein PHE29_05970 [Tissierellia bacterium]|nr:hypothetical protein [Tissierellia bacterium]MDD4780416.1 hypothetical protein [Tissierellia bacterium]
MSAFLGPIHHWLYNKISIQHNIVENIISYTEENNMEIDLRNALDEKFGKAEMKPLEKVIDVTNIHGWLQEKVSLEEYRLAYAVTSILSKEPNVLEDIKTIFYNMGKRISDLCENKSLVEVYKTINDTLLDGMPCDRANELLLQDENEVVWRRNVCVHKNYWSEVNGDIDIYYLLRDEFISGLLDKINVNYEKVNEVTSKISRR